MAQKRHEKADWVELKIRNALAMVCPGEFENDTLIVMMATMLSSGYDKLVKRLGKNGEQIFEQWIEIGIQDFIRTQQFGGDDDAK